MTDLTVHATYRVILGKEEEFFRLLGLHWPTLNELSLVTDHPVTHFHRRDQNGRMTIVEIFTWKSVEASKAAHGHPKVAAIWEPMCALCEDRDSFPAMDFPHYTRFSPVK